MVDAGRSGGGSIHAEPPQDRGQTRRGPDSRSLFGCGIGWSLRDPSARAWLPSRAGGLEYASGAYESAPGGRAHTRRRRSGLALLQLPMRIRREGCGVRRRQACACPLMAWRERLEMVVLSSCLPALLACGLSRFRLRILREYPPTRHGDAFWKMDASK